MASQPDKQTIVIYVLPNILRNKDNQAMKFGQLREYNMKNTKFGGETSARPFSQKLELRISLDQMIKIFIQFVLLHLQVDDYHNVLKLSC